MLSLAALVLSLTSCSSDNEKTIDEKPVRINLSCSQIAVDGSITTRAGINEHSVLNGEQVNVYMPQSTITTVMTYTVAAASDANGKSEMTTSPIPYLYPSTTPIYGIYPTAATISADQLSYSVSLDQTTTANYKLSDLMYATSSAARSDANLTTGAISIDLVFHHLMSKVIVEVEGVPSEFEIIGIYLVNVGKTLSLTPSTYTTISHDDFIGLTTSNVVGSSTNYTQGVKMGTSSGCAALIPPQTVRGQFIVVEARGVGSKSVHQGIVTYALSQDETYRLLPGRTYKVKLKMDTWDFGETLIISVSDWSNIDNPESVGEPRLAV